MRLEPELPVLEESRSIVGPVLRAGVNRRVYFLASTDLVVASSPSALAGTSLVLLWVGVRVCFFFFFLEDMAAMAWATRCCSASYAARNFGSFILLANSACAFASICICCC